MCVDLHAPSPVPKSVGGRRRNGGGRTSVMGWWEGRGRVGLWVGQPRERGRDRILTPVLTWSALVWPLRVALPILGRCALLGGKRMYSSFPGLPRVGLPIPARGEDCTLNDSRANLSEAPEHCVWHRTIPEHLVILFLCGSSYFTCTRKEVQVLASPRRAGMENKLHLKPWRTAASLCTVLT